MKTKHNKRRRRGLLADEIAKTAKVTRYKAKRCIEIMKDAPELMDFVTNGDLKLKQAIEIMKHWPELVSYVVSGKLRGAQCDRVIRQLRQLAEPELTFEQEVERSYMRWLSKWPKEDRKEVRDIVEFMPAAKLVDVMPSQAPEFFHGRKRPQNQTKTK
jgi:hypothetical protein